MNIAADEAFDMEEDTQKGKILTFTIGKESYGFEIRYVTEIIGIQPIIEIPELPNYIKGIINLRGKIIPVMDVRVRFKKEYQVYNDRTCIIVVDFKDIYIGLIVDSVSEVLAIPDQDIEPPPNLKADFHHKYVKGIGKVGNDVKLILDCERLLTDDQIKSLESVS